MTNFSFFFFFLKACTGVFSIFLITFLFWLSLPTSHPSWYATVTGTSRSCDVSTQLPFLVFQQGAVLRVYTPSADQQICECD